MDSLSSLSPSIVLPQGSSSNPLHNHLKGMSFSSQFLKPAAASQFRLLYSTSNHHYSQDYAGRVRRRSCHSSHVGCCNIVRGEKGKEENKRRDEDVEKALHTDGRIPGSSDEFIKQVSSRLMTCVDISNNHLTAVAMMILFSVLEAPLEQPSKPVHVLTHRENHEVERELGLLSTNGDTWRNEAKQSGNGTKFQMLVEDIREGVLVFEDQTEAAKYYDLLQGGGQDCEGVAEIEAPLVFDLCRKMRALAVLFRRGRTPPLPESLKLNLRARN